MICLSFVLMLVGGYLSVKFGFLQITSLKEWLFSTVKTFFTKKARQKTDKHTVTPFQSLCTSLAATIGTGNIAGVATAIALAGPGAVFWMWCSAFFSMAIGYTENVLGMLHRKKLLDGSYRGGAVAYIERGLNMPLLSKIYAANLALGALGVGNLVQSNSAAAGAVKIIEDIFCPQKNTLIIVLVCILLTAFVGILTFGGLKAVTAVTEKVVPLMAVLYILGSLAVIVLNYSKLPMAFVRIFKFAFLPKSVAGGSIGYSVMLAMRHGVSFGVFSNEAGLGSSVSGHTAVSNSTPRQMGMWNMFEVFFDTVVICTLTALAILTSGVYDESAYLNLFSQGVEPPMGVNLALNAFLSAIGPVANIFLSVMTVLFAVSSTAAWCYYGLDAVEYVFNNKTAVLIYKIIFVSLVPLGCIFKSVFVWDLSEALNLTLAIPNLAAVCVLSGEVKKYNKGLIKNG